MTTLYSLHFMDCNGRLGRLWQTLILGCWKPVFFMIPIENVIRDRRTDYYGALRSGDEAGNSTLFIEFLLNAILAGCLQLTGEVAVEVTGEVKKFLKILTNNNAAKVLINSVLASRNICRYNKTIVM